MSASVFSAQGGKLRVEERPDRNGVRVVIVTPGKTTYVVGDIKATAWRQWLRAAGKLETALVEGTTP